MGKLTQFTRKYFHPPGVIALLNSTSSTKTGAHSAFFTADKVMLLLDSDRPSNCAITFG
jgi:hypothetical protein